MWHRPLGCGFLPRTPNEPGDNEGLCAEASHGISGICLGSYIVQQGVEVSRALGFTGCLFLEEFSSWCGFVSRVGSFDISGSGISGSGGRSGFRLQHGSGVLGCGSGMEVEIFDLYLENHGTVNASKCIRNNIVSFWEGRSHLKGPWHLPVDVFRAGSA